MRVMSIHWMPCCSDQPDESFQTTGNRQGRTAESVFIAGMFVYIGPEYVRLCEKRGLDQEAQEAAQHTGGPTAEDAAIAIVGMAGRFPGARNLDEFWTNLQGGVESVSFFSREEMAGEGVTRVLLDDPNYVVGELEFETSAEAQACGAALRELWNSRLAAPALIGAPQVRIVEAVEDRQY